MLNNEFVINIGTKKDINSLVQIISEANKPVALDLNLTLENCPKHPSNCNSGWIADAIGKGEIFFIIQVNGETVGCMAYQDATDDICYLNRLAVLPKFQNRGVGEVLVNHFESYAKKRSKIIIGIGVIDQNLKLKEWYSKLGFTQTKIKKFNHLPFNVCFMEKNI